MKSSLGTRLVSSLLLLGLSIGGLAGCSRPKSDSPVRVGCSAWPGWFPWKVSEAKGLFNSNGVPVSLQWFDGYLDSINALNVSQLDCNIQTLGDTISSMAGGADLQVVLTNDCSTGNDQIISAPGINSAADLKGKRVASEEGTVDHYLLLLGLKQAGLSGRDITFVPLETGAAAAAFLAGKVDAVGVFAPFTSEEIKRPGSKTLFSSRDFPGAISDHLVCRRQFVSNNPQAVQKLVQTWFDTLKQMRNEPQATLAIISERAGVSEVEYKEYDAGTTILSLDQNKKIFKQSGNMQSLPYAANQIAVFLQQQGLAKTPPKLDTLLQPQFVDGVK